MPATTNAEIYIALRDRLASFPGLPFVAYPGETYSAPTSANGTPQTYWIVDDMRLPITTRFVGNDDPDTYTGNLYINIMASTAKDSVTGLPVMTHPQLMYQVGLIANHFPKGIDMWIGDTRLTVTDTPFLTVTPYADGIYRRAPVAIPWRLSA